MARLLRRLASSLNAARVQSAPVSRDFGPKQESASNLCSAYVAFCLTKKLSSEEKRKI
jgi:hypothetical protein